MSSIKNNYPIGVNSYLFKNKENALAYGGVQGAKLEGTNQNKYEERLAREEYGYWDPQAPGLDEVFHYALYLWIFNTII